MERVLASDTKKLIGKEVLLQGSLHKIRNLGGICFGMLRDRSGIIQIKTEDKDSLLPTIKRESIIEVIGIVNKEDKAPDGVEVVINKLNIINEVKEDLPFEIDKDEINASLDTILNYRAISVRNLRIRSIFKVQAVLLKAFRDFFENNGFTEINTSKIIENATEGGTEVFKIKYFDRDAYLAQSPQFYKQMMIGAFERVYETNFVYRAEKHNTSKHLNEYMSMDVEMGYINSVDDVMDMEQEYLRYAIKVLDEECKEDLKRLNATLPIIPPTSIPRIKFEEAQKILDEKYGQHCFGENDFEPEHERLIGEYAKNELGSDFIFVTQYKTVKRPMYTMVDPNNPELSYGFDLMFKGLEITSGAQREHRYDELIKNMERKGLNPKDFEDYLISFKYGLPPHGGFAIGLERLTAQFLNISNVRETTILPRDLNRLNP
ncbi:MAG TPA: aspartate--tRNA(Asn) ligase [bacterium]|nr:aspartate--tRNA(Asn) ligase [bacterium]